MPPPVPPNQNVQKTKSTKETNMRHMLFRNKWHNFST
jgi:hypothetical protein